MFGIDDAAIALLVGSAISTAGSLYANKANNKAQQSINDQNLAIAAMNNATQVDMANTAHSREVADLRAAGLNPILSAGGSGAAVPQLQAASLRAPTFENPTSTAAQSATALSRIVNANTVADTAQKEANTSNLLAQNKNLQVQNELLQAQTRETDARTEQLKHPATKGFRDIVDTVVQSGRRGEWNPTTEPQSLHRTASLEKALERPDKPVQAHSARSASVYEQLVKKELERKGDHMILHMSDAPDKYPNRSGRHMSIYTH